MSEHKCPKCDFKSLKLYNTRRHFLRFHGHENDQCEEEVKNSVDNVKNSVDNVKNSVDNVKNSVDNVKKGVDNICHRCGKNFCRKSYLNVHLETCEGKKDPFGCDFCDRTFVTRSNKYHHMKICKEKLSDLKQLTINNNNNIINNTTNNITNNNNINNTINIQLNNFGKEDTSYLSPDYLDKCYELGAPSIKNMVISIYFDENHPENHTVKLISLKNEYVNVHEDGNWLPRTITDAITSMKQKATDTLLEPKKEEIDSLVNKNNINEEDCDKIVKIQELQNVPTDSNKNISNAIKVNLIALRDKYCKST